MNEDEEKAEMWIISQSSVGEEIIKKNATEKQVHVVTFFFLWAFFWILSFFQQVVKNLVFNIEIGSTIDLNTCASPGIEAKLLYEYDEDDGRKTVKDREVSYVKNQPLDYKLKISEGGKKATLELRIKVLTSQHEDMLFQVYISATSPGGQPFGVLSQPIKVVSKITQVASKRNSMEAISPSAGKKRTASSQGGLVLPVGSSDLISGTIMRMERSEKSTNDMVRAIYQKLLPDTPFPPSVPLDFNPPSLDSSLCLDPNESPSSSDLDETQSAFVRFMQFYQALPMDQRHSTLLKLIPENKRDSAQVFFDVLDSLNFNASRKKKRTQ